MRKILVAVHGYEPRAWAEQAVGALLRAEAPIVRILVVLDVPSPPFTSLLPAARRQYLAARSEWQRQMEAQAEPSVAAVAASLRPPPEVERIVVQDGDPGRAIVEHARAWFADLVVVGRDTRGPIDRALASAVHKRVVDEAPCAVFVTSAEAEASSGSLTTGRWRFARRSPAVARGA